MFEELRPLGPGRPPKAVRALRVFGTFAMVSIVLATLLTEPRPAVGGEGLWVTVSLLTFIVSFAVVVPYRRLAPGRRFVGLLFLGAASCALTALQPDGLGIGGVYVTVIIAALHLPQVAALAVCVPMIAAETLIIDLSTGKPEGAEVAFLTSIIPWYLIMRLIRELQTGRVRAERLVEELRESRAAEAEAAAQAERGRLARDMHDLLAHSLSALALQLEAARLLARDRGADPEVVEALERGHRLAAGGLDEARRAIGALRGEELPGPERLEALAEAFEAQSEATCRVTVTGEPRPLEADARLALYRTAQEALTNVRRHSAAERVEIAVGYEPEGVTLTVQDDGDGAPAPVGTDGGGYGLTGMRERAELLGGRLRAGRSNGGFRVELWLPA
jgi:signal transduction histidine kinase